MEELKRQATSHDPIVYYLAFGDRVKIGTTTNLAERLKAIPHDELLVTEAGSFQTEGMRHRLFAELRLIGEWFMHSEALDLHIVQLMHASA